MSTIKSTSSLNESPLWDQLRQLTDARISLGRSGHALPTKAHLSFQMDHANARDAVWQMLDSESLIANLRSIRSDIQFQSLATAAANREMYLKRPDMGRSLNAQSRQQLKSADVGTQEIVVVIADGLSALAVEQQVPKLWSLLSHGLDALGFSFSPVYLVSQGRVAVGDDIAQALNATRVLVLIGERPGLSSPDSLGIYYTYAPKVGAQDAQRNCISNVRDAGLLPEQAVDKLLWLIRESDKIQASGVVLKDESDQAVLEGENHAQEASAFSLLPPKRSGDSG